MQNRLDTKTLSVTRANQGIRNKSKFIVSGIFHFSALREGRQQKYIHLYILTHTTHI